MPPLDSDTVSAPRLVGVDATHLTIGQFSQYTRLSVRMLRHYDSLGLLHPEAVDPTTGYRFYGPDQLGTGLLIRRLRDLDMPLSAIVALLSDQPQPRPERVVAAVRAHCHTLEADAQALAQRLADAEHLIHDLEGVTMRTFTLDNTPARSVVSLREPLASYSAEGAQWGRFMDLLGQSGIASADLSLAGVVTHDQEAKASDCDVELWVETADAHPLVTPLTRRILDGGSMLTHLVTGPYESIDFGSEWSASVGEASARGLVVNGPCRNVYLVGPSQGGDPAEYQTEFCLPVA